VLDTVPEATASRSPANCSTRAFLVSMLNPRCSEPYRLSARVNSLRGYAHGTTESVFP
jgi:hypothetical protein